MEEDKFRKASWMQEGRLAKAARSKAALQERILQRSAMITRPE